MQCVNTSNQLVEEHGERQRLLRASPSGLTIITGIAFEMALSAQLGL